MVVRSGAVVCGRGGISEAAYLGEQGWRLSAGVLGETALPGFCGVTALNGSIGPDSGRGATEGLRMGLIFQHHAWTLLV